MEYEVGKALEEIYTRLKRLEDKAGIKGEQE